MAAEVREWESLPATALVSIFRKLGVKDRFTGGPLVCRTWNEASRYHMCWESMLPEGESPEFHFIKHPCRFYNPDEDWDSFSEDSFEDGGREVRPLHYACNLSLHGFRSFVDRSQGCATTIYLPFHCDVQDSKDMLRFIAPRCPKLKHLSFKRFWLGSATHFRAFIRSCKDLELLDVGDESHFSPTMLQEVGRRCPGFLGLRYAYSPYCGRDFGSILGGCFCQLQLLNLEFTDLDGASLLTILKGCKQLRYMSVVGCGEDIGLGRSKIAKLFRRIPEFLFDEYDSD